MISFLICSHRAPPSLNGTLESLARQTLAVPFEVLLINNGFGQAAEHRLTRVAATLGLANHFRIHRESLPGLGFARKCAFQHAQGTWFVLLDDDNTIGPAFVENLPRCLAASANLGGITPMVAPVWETAPPAWLHEFGVNCLSYNLPGTFKTRPHERRYAAAEFHQADRPPGGGMIIHRSVAEHYLRTADVPARLALERTGESLVGCQDEDIWCSLKALKLDILVTDKLEVFHHIPARRLRKQYLLRLNYQMACSYVVLGRLRGDLAPETPARLVRAAFWSIGRIARDLVLRPHAQPFWLRALYVARELGSAAGYLKRLEPAAPTGASPSRAVNAVS